ncbi:MAG: GntR family transcriptional regulator [Armatimonadota bacterium]|nr:GntR family transcriptional regulator [Armatimonadota bacterium]
MVLDRALWMVYNWNTMVKATTKDATRASKEWIYEQLKKDILSDSLHPGEPLVERALVKRFGVSRTPIREVLRRLEQEHLVEVHPNRGVLVRKLTLEDVRNIFEMRLAIEPAAARLAAERHDVHELENIHEAFLKVTIQNNPETLQHLVALGADLHDFIARSTRNELFIEISHQLRNLMILIRNMTQQHFDIEKRSYVAHMRIIKALLQRNPVQSERAMRNHLLETWRGILEMSFKGSS